jgi:hypothetical protein
LIDSQRVSSIAAVKPTLWGLILLFASSGLSPVGASDLEPPESTSDLPNHAFTLESGFGGYDAGEQEVQSLRLPFSFTPRSLEEHPWGLKLRLPISLWLYSVDLPDFLEGLNLDNVSAIALVPEAEFRIPVSRRWMLKPYVKAGVAKDFAGGDLIFVGGTGLKGLYTHPLKTTILSFGSAVKYDVSHSSSGLNNDDFASIEVGLDAGRPLGFSFGDRQAEGSIYVIARNFFRNLTFQQVTGRTLVLEQLYEVGLTFGTSPRPVFWKFSLPRFGVGYRFGENFRGVRLFLGFPF